METRMEMETRLEMETRMERRLEMETRMEMETRIEMESRLYTETSALLGHRKVEEIEKELQKPVADLAGFRQNPPFWLNPLNPN